MTKHVLETIDAKVIGERLADARRARRLTQQHAADELGIARTTVTAIEQGVRPPRASELVTLARLYGRQVGDFVRSGPERAGPGFAVQFRVARGANDEADDGRDADIQRFEDLCRWYGELEALVGAPLARRYPEVYDTSGTPPERAAEEVATSERNRLGLGDGPIGDLWGILETDVGLRVFALPMLGKGVAGMFVYSAELGGCIAVNANHREERRRWSAAHEYAHFLRDRYRPEITVSRGTARKPDAERFADAFARHFLMPEAGLTRRFRAIRRAKNKPITPVDVLTLGHLYKVSFQGMMWRLEELKLIDAGSWNTLNEQGFKPSSARTLADVPPPVLERSLLPLRYEMLAAQAFANGELSEGRLARWLMTDRVSARLRVRELTEPSEPTDDGGWRQIALDLNASLVGAV